MCGAVLPYVVMLAGFVVSVTYSLLLYPMIADPWHVVLDPDGYGRLGYGIWQYASFSYFPDHASTVNRGPAYPLFLPLFPTAARPPVGAPIARARSA